jgi:hypothetical protein
MDLELSPSEAELNKPLFFIKNPASGILLYQQKMDTMRNRHLNNLAYSFCRDSSDGRQQSPQWMLLSISVHTRLEMLQPGGDRSDCAHISFPQTSWLSFQGIRGLH